MQHPNAELITRFYAGLAARDGIREPAEHEPDGRRGAVPRLPLGVHAAGVELPRTHL